MDALTIAAIGMQNDLTRLNGISQNLANVLTPGYKREIHVTSSFGDALKEAAAHSPEVAAGKAPAVALDPAAGTLRHTGNPLDVAIEGEGYFEVMTDNGPLYTRQGFLRVDARGRLVTEQGHAVMGKSGELLVSGTSMTIDPNGEIRQGDRLVGQLKLVRFANPGSLSTAGNGLFRQGDARMADGDTGASVRAGYRENSNVNSSQEMIRLAETVRHFEALQKIVQGYEDALDKTMRKLGEF